MVSFGVLTVGSAAPCDMPVRPQVDDSEAAEGCMICSCRWSKLRRKHHCRRCGWVICKECSTKVQALKGSSFTILAAPKVQSTSAPTPHRQSSPAVLKHRICLLCRPDVMENSRQQEMLRSKPLQEGSTLAAVDRAANSAATLGAVVAVIPAAGAAKVVGGVIFGTALAVKQYCTRCRRVTSSLERQQQMNELQREIEQRERRLHMLFDSDDGLGYAAICEMQDDLVKAYGQLMAILDEPPGHLLATEMGLEPEPEPDVEADSTTAAIRTEITLLRQMIARKEELLKLYRPAHPVGIEHHDACVDGWRDVCTKCRGLQLRESYRRVGKTYTNRIKAKFEEQLVHLAQLCEPARVRMPASSSTTEWCSRAVIRRQWQMPLRILTIDGGGSKGLLPAIVLERIEELCAPHKLHEVVDLVAGTSTGGILALGAGAAKVAIPVLTECYERRASEIWTATDKPQDWKYTDAGLVKMLTEFAVDWGDYPAVPCPLRRGPDEYPKVFVVAAEQKQGVAVGAPFKRTLLRTYDNPRLRRRRPVACQTLVEAARATSAAPTYFPPLELELHEGQRTVLVDGGIVANNPTMIALDEARDLWPEATIGTVLSLGCGLCPKANDDIPTYVELASKVSEKAKLAYWLKQQMTDAECAHLQALEELLGHECDYPEPTELAADGVDSAPGGGGADARLGGRATVRSPASCIRTRARLTRTHWSRRILATHDALARTIFGSTHD